MGFHQYDPANVKLIFGPVLVEGYAEGSTVNVEYNNDQFTLQVGSDGESSRSKSNNNSARLTVMLMPGAAANIGLGAALTADKAIGLGVFPLALTESVPRTLTVWIAPEGASELDVEVQDGRGRLRHG